MAVDPDVENALKFAKDAADRISKAQEKLDKMFNDELSKEIPDAIKENDDVILKLKLTDLQKAIQGMESNLEDTLRALDWIDTVNKDEDYSSAHHDEIQKITSIVASTRTKLTHQIEAAKKLEITAKKGLETAATSKEVAERELDEIEERINSEKKYLPGFVKKAEDANTKAEQAVDARDSKALADAQKALDAVGIDAMTMSHDVQDYENRINAFLKKIQDEGLDPDVVSQFKDDIKKLLATNQENAKDLKRLADLKKAVGDAKIGEFDVKKVLKILQFDPKVQSKVEPLLAKVLKGPGKDMERGLDGLAKQFKPSATGKQMFAAIKKAGDAAYK